ncbi:hypothetical protein BJF85_11260 [Saccharomonospora sp. CUA-673]|nr:hypothetical protein BJF85_11260 [Saccharomonospora sp. CUA-673]
MPTDDGADSAWAAATAAGDNDAAPDACAVEPGPGAVEPGPPEPEVLEPDARGAPEADVADESGEAAPVAAEGRPTSRSAGSVRRFHSLTDSSV